MNVQTHPLAQSPVSKARPNLFRLAPSELAQEAFLGWLLE